MRKFLAGLAAMAVLAVGAGRADAVFFTDSAAFHAANPGLSVLTFEGIAPPGGYVEPAPQPIAPGVLFSSPSLGTSDISVADPGFFFGTPSAALFVDEFSEPLDILLDPSVLAVGFDLASGFDGGPVTVEVFNGGTLLDSTVVTVPDQTIFTGFIGVSGVGPITSVRVSPILGEFILIDNLAYGNVVPEPSSIALVGLGGLSLVGYAIRRRRATVA